MSARDELFQLMLGRTTTKAVERILAAGYSKPRTITTVDELNALPGEAVLRNAKGNICEVWTLELGEGPSIMVYSVPGNAEDWPVDRIALPATVLWEPQP